MTFLVLYSFILAFKGLTKADKHNKECGMKTFRREPRFDRNPRIIDGSITIDGEFPWQVSLEVLHPAYGFLGHWCGGVLIDEHWIISAAHCIHNDIFNLPLPPLWTAVLGDHNRISESGYEKRIPIEKIITHNGYENFQHDLVLLKLAEGVGLDKIIKKICLPIAPNQFSYFTDESWKQNLISDRQLKLKRNSTRGRRKNDKFLRFNDDTERHQEKNLNSNRNFNVWSNTDLPFIDCVATGWGKSTSNENLTDTLFKTRVLIYSNKRCQDVYGNHVNIHDGHLCGGTLSGKGGTCIGDSGGPLNCRLYKNGPWILAGITSFGSGCMDEGYHPDVYIRISYYINWIMQTMSEN